MKLSIRKGLQQLLISLEFINFDGMSLMSHRFSVAYL